MNKKLLLAIGIAAIVLIASPVIWLFVTHRATNTRTTSSTLSAMSTKQALALKRSGACLINNPTTKANVENMQGLAEDSGIYTEEIYDVPAGTNVDVSISSYNSAANTVAGSLAYSNQYDSYNFILTKQSDGWRYAAFTRCS